MSNNKNVSIWALICFSLPVLIVLVWCIMPKEEPRDKVELPVKIKLVNRTSSVRKQHTEPSQTDAPAQSPVKVETPYSGQHALVKLLTEQMKSSFSISDPQCTFQSQHNQDWFVILNALMRIKDGFYVDVGANDFKTISNTWFLDKCMGWKGLCVEPNPVLAERLRQHRSCIVFNGCVSTYATNLTLVITQGVHVGARVEKSCGPPKPGETCTSVPCLPLSELLERYKIKKVDFMSLDVEGHEPMAIASFPKALSPPIDIVSIEISTGRIQRALSQYPLLTRGFVSLTPLIGDSIMVRRSHSLLHRRKLVFPHTPYFEQWWMNLCYNFEKLTRPLCTKLGWNFLSQPKLELERVQLNSTFKKWEVKNNDECKVMLERSTTQSTLSADYSQDWFVINNPSLSLHSGTPSYVEIAGPSQPWGLGSNTWYMDKCLGWKGTCVVFDEQQAEEWRKHRTCDVKVGCRRKHCNDLGCKGQLCQTLQCPQNITDVESCFPLTEILKSYENLNVLSVHIDYAPFVVGLITDWDEFRKAKVVMVNGDHRTNYKKMHWPLSVRGYVLVGTFHGNDVFSIRSRRLPRKLEWPKSNSTTLKWLEGELTAYHLPTDVVSKLVADPF